MADTGNKRIVVFDSRGQGLTAMGEVGFGPGQLDEPVGVAVDSGGPVYVADTWNQRIQVFVETSQNAFSFDREFLAASGYVVMAINYRGSAGRGNAYQKAILGNWGNLEVMDLLGGVDEAVRQGVADPNRLGIGGWSYGGISTDAAIATDTRFKAAVSGAGVALYMSLYGVGQYIIHPADRPGFSPGG